MAKSLPQIPEKDDTRAGCILQYVDAKPLSNPAAGLIRDTIAHHGISQAEAAEAMKVSKAQLSDVIRQKKAVSANLALRAQFLFGLPGELLIRLQAQFDFQKAFHSKNADLQMEVRAIA